MNEEPYSCEIIMPWFLEINFEVLSERPPFFNAECIRAAGAGFILCCVAEQQTNNHATTMPYGNWLQGSSTA